MMRAYVWASSDTERDPERKPRWGDYWLKLRLEQELARQGWQVDEHIEPATDVFIHCFGGNTISNLPAHCYNVLYIHSHPARLAGFDYGMYDRVVAGSEKLVERLAEQGIAATWNIGATDFKPLDVPMEREAVFVGNARERRSDGHLTRPIIEALGDLTTLPFKLEVWGEGWDWLPKGIWQGPYIPNDELNALYSGSAVVLNDTHADMVEAGIMNPRVLDAIRAGAKIVDENCEHPRRVIERAMEARRGRWPTLDGGEDWSYARLVRDLVGNIEPLLRLDLGCGSHKRESFVGLDRVRCAGVDVVWDARDGLPSADGSVDYIVVDNLMEHIGEPFITVMNELHRALRAGGRLTVIVPGTHTPAAFADPTHVRYFTPETWDYFDGASPRWADYGKSYGIKPWKVLRRETRDRFIDVVLQPVKECQCES